jgi:choline dehydrogenase-like flavoprotein
VYCVVGSGPSGVAAAAALLDEGRPVTMLDVGETRDPDAPVGQWKLGDLKLAYGSTFAYALDEMRGDKQEGTRLVQSFARGGLSNVWGAALLPARARDCEDWPFHADTLKPHYEAVARSMPIAAVEDDLAADFPLAARSQPPLQPSRQAVALIETLSRHRAPLAAEGITFGRSRLAVRTAPGAKGSGCLYTGLCLTGCPHSAIWTSADMLETLQPRNGFTYRAGFRVDAVVKDDSGRGVRVEGMTSEGRTESMPASRVFLACGPVSTARIVLHSLRRYDQPIALKYQPYFLLPMLTGTPVKHVESEALHTLSQVFVEMTNADVTRHTVHLQFYTYNNLLGERLRAATRWFGPIGPLARETLAGRLLVVQGYLHSATAPSISLTARFDAAKKRTRLDFRAGPPPRDAVKRVIATLQRHRRYFGAVPLTPLLRIGIPGEGNHCGGSFPMRAQPGPLETDVNGELSELRGVHVVDSSVLPSLPATTFTYAVMANADRIARAVAHCGS